MGEEGRQDLEGAFTEHLPPPPPPSLILKEKYECWECISYDTKVLRK